MVRVEGLGRAVLQILDSGLRRVAGRIAGRSASSAGAARIVDAMFAARPLRRVAQSLAMFVLASASASAKVDVEPFAGTYRTVGGNTEVHVRVQPDGVVEFFAPADGRRMRGTALFNAIGGPGFTGVTADGQAFGVGLVQGTRALSVGTQVVALVPMPAGEYGRAVRSAPAADGRRGPGGALAGLRLTTASSRNGYSRLRSLDFCSDGTVHSRFEELQSSQFGNAAGTRADAGSWRLAGNVLEMRLARGGFVRARLQPIAADVVAIDGARFAVERSPRCR